MKLIGTISFAISMLLSATVASTAALPLSVFDRPEIVPSQSSVIKGIQVFGGGSGIAYTAKSVFRTDDNGETWTELSLPYNYSATIASVWFENENNGIAVFADRGTSTLLRFDTNDGGRTWMHIPMGSISEEIASDLANSDLDSAKIRRGGNGSETLSLRLSTSSNFILRVEYERERNGLGWGKRRLYENDPRHEASAWSLKKLWAATSTEFPGRIKTGFLPEDMVVERDGNTFHALNRAHSNWYVTQNGSCEGYKSGCVLATRLYKDVSFERNGVTTISFADITPPQIVELNRIEKEGAKAEAGQHRMFALPPGGSIRTSLNRGFDKCQAGSVAQMRIWWDNSYHFDTNIYFSGRARACPNQPFTNNPAWIDQVSGMGWGIIPTVVGFQSPCSVSTTPHKHSSDPALAEQQGRGEADIAAADAASIGLTAGSVLYYDMERYDETVATPGCRTATVAFLKGWTDRIRALGYVSGVYGSPTNAVADWIGMGASRMDAVWLARWDNAPSVWTYASPSPVVPTNVWNSHQRIKQWQAPHNETWGGVTFNIDGNIADGPVAGVAVPRNKVADFDGDGKTDISVFRPGTGRWFVQGTLGPSFSIYEYGTAEDVLTPGDYDGDGKTDLVVFRPSNSTWYLRTKGAFGVRQYGEAGDVPAPADYNGDRRTDIAVFRPSTGIWYIANSDSRNTFVQIPFGQAGDRPAAADYDGDGKADIAVWRPANGTWYVQGSAGGYFTSQWGVASDLPAQADYDGDGRADLAVFRPATGTWYIVQSAGGLRFQGFGVDGDLPATGDYDGDGRYDVAVFRPSNNTWYMSQSLGGFVVREFGAAGDKTIPGAYLPR